MIEVLERLRAGLIVSVQAAQNSPLDNPSIIAAMAQAAVEGGAVAVRIQGVANITAVQKAVDVPVIGLIKRIYAGYEPYITPSMREVGELLATGVPVIAFDATSRARPDATDVAAIAGAIREGGALAMADCAQADEGLAALDAGCEIVASTLCGYTPATHGSALPALGLLSSWKNRGFVICEGGVHSPQHAVQARAHGADAVVVGTAITNVQWVTGEFARAIARAL